MWALIEFYALAVFLVGLLIAPMIWVIRIANRACKSRRWPKVLAAICWSLWIVVMLVPFAVFGAEWATVWSILNLPFSMVLEMWAATGTAVYLLTCSIVTATFWTTAVFLLSAIVVRLRRKAA